MSQKWQIDLMAHMHQAYDIMLEICPNKTPFTKTYMPRTVGKEYEKLNTQIIELKRIRQEANIKMKHPQCTYTQPKTTTSQRNTGTMPRRHRTINCMEGTTRQHYCRHTKADGSDTEWTSTKKNGKQEEKSSAPRWQNSLR